MRARVNHGVKAGFKSAGKAASFTAMLFTLLYTWTSEEPRPYCLVDETDGSSIEIDESHHGRILFAMMVLITVSLYFGFRAGRRAYDEYDPEDHWIDEGTIADIEENDYEKRLKAIGWDGVVPDEFKCSGTLGVMYTPVILLTKNHESAGSFSYEEELILRVMQRKEVLCPMTRKPFDGYIINKNLKEAIENWVLRLEKNHKRFQETPGLQSPRFFKAIEASDESSKAQERNLRASI